MTTAIKDMSREELKKAMARGAIVVVDVREPGEFALGHIPGSLNLPLSGFDPALLPRTERRIVFSCAAGVRSAQAIERAQAGGHDVDTHYRGGFKEWAAAGEEISRP